MFDSFSPFSPSITNDVNVSIATSLHQRLPFSGRDHHLSSPDTLRLTQTTFKITEYIHILVLKNICIFVYVHIIHLESILYTQMLCVVMNQSSRTPQHSKWELCGCKQATAHAHLQPHGVCDWTLNTPRIRIFQKIRDDEIRIRIC